MNLGVDMRRLDVFYQVLGYTFLSAGLLVMAIGGWLMLAARPAGAYCMANESDTRVFVRAEPADSASEVAPVLRWVEPGNRFCSKPDGSGGRVSVFVFADEDAIEGCDAEMRSDGELRLTSFEEFDRCAWQGSLPIASN